MLPAGKIIIDKTMSAIGGNFTPSHSSNCDTTGNILVVIGMNTVFIKNTTTTCEFSPPDLPPITEVTVSADFVIILCAFIRFNNIITIPSTNTLLVK